MILEDYYMYVKISIGGILFLTLYVDNMLLVRNNWEMMKATKNWLSSVFDMKDMSEVRYVLSGEIIRNHPKKLLGMSQNAYMKNV